MLHWLSDHWFMSVVCLYVNGYMTCVSYMYIVTGNSLEFAGVFLSALLLTCVSALTLASKQASVFPRVIACACVAVVAE